MTKLADYYINIKYLILVVFSLIAVNLSVTATIDDINVIPNDSIVTDEEVDNWLEKYATEIRDSVMLPSVNLKNNKVVVSPKVDSVKAVKTILPATIKEVNVVQKPIQKQKSGSSLTLSAKNNKKQKGEKLAIQKKNEVLKYSTFLSEEDSLEITQYAQRKARCNPLFIDWVFGLPASISLTLDNSDSVIVDLRRDSHRYIRTNYPELYSYHRTQLPAFSDINIGIIQNKNKENVRLKVDGVNFDGDKLMINQLKIQQWFRGAKFQVHLSQTYITPNWHKGGESNMAANFYIMGYYNYNNKKNIQWDNKIEWKLGLNSAGSDSLRWLRVNDDLLRINTKLGIKAFKSFFYTAEYDLQTQLFNTYKPNSYVRTTGPFSPLKMNLSLGMDYKFKNKLSIFLSPISYKLVYIADTVSRHGIDPTENLAYQAGIKEGKRSMNQLGGLLRINWAHNFNDAIGMEVKYYFFANYIGETKGVEMDCEIIGNFRINRYLSAKITLNPRYDTTIILCDGSKPKFQFKEFISLGFNYII
ncbi:MAG: DUF3078 domain-containing protein [Candidatus Aphodosoma sp.]